MRKRVCIINTGGTIGMVPTARGYAPKQGFIRTALDEISDLKSEVMPLYDLIEYSPLYDSSNISLDDWVKIAEDIKEQYDTYDGFVILHGTDTMAYTASALSFMLDGLTKPVILTGSQIPLCEIRNDARDNVITALYLAGNYQIPEVCLYFRNKLLRGNRSVKISADDLIAFDSPNYPALAEAEIQVQLHEKLIAKPGNGLIMRAFRPTKIAVLKIFPGIQFELFESMLTPDLKGIVIEAFGAGNIPDSHGALLNLLKKANKNGTIMVVCTQCLRGSAIIGIYQSSEDLVDAGAISGYDMTIEATVTKLYYLLSLNYDQDTIKRMMGRNLRGEIGEQ